MTEKSTARQTLTGLIRSRMASYQARQLAGELQKTFAAELNAEGYPTNYKDFRTLYSRAKKQLEAPKRIQREERKETPKIVAETERKMQPQASQADEIEDNTSHRPTDLDAIIHQTPNLADLAKLAKQSRRNQK